MWSCGELGEKFRVYGKSKRVTPKSRKTCASGGVRRKANGDKGLQTYARRRAGGLAIHCTSKVLPSKSGMAFVVIYHWRPSMKARCPLLSTVTSVPAVEVSDGLAGDPNHFSTALTEERGNAVIGVVHSETGPEGS